MFGLVFSTNQLLGTIPQLNQVCQVGLQLLKKETKFYKKYGSTNVCYDLFHLASLSLTFCPAQRIPTKRFLAPIQVCELPTGCPNKVSTKPLQMQFSIWFKFFSSDHFQASSTFNINPLLVLILTRTKSRPSHSHWHNGEKHNNYLFLQVPFYNKKKLHFFLPSNKPSFSFESRLLSLFNLLFFSSSLHTWIAFGHPSSTATLFHITHKQQTFLLTTTNKQWRNKPRHLNEKSWWRFNT